MSTEGEDRLVHAVCLMVERYVAQQMPEHQRGAHARFLDHSVVKARVLGALNLIVVDLSGTITEKLRRLGPIDTILPGARTTVLNNTEPCAECGRVTRCAAVTTVDGLTVLVECEAHAREFR